MRALTGVDESKPAPRKAPKAPAVKATKAKPVAPAKKAAARRKPVPARSGETKKSQLFAMITKGATTAEIADAFGWLPHTTRGALSRFCQMYKVEKLKVEGGTRYKIAS